MAEVTRDNSSMDNYETIAILISQIPAWVCRKIMLQ